MPMMADIDDDVVADADEPMPMMSGDYCYWQSPVKIVSPCGHYSQIRLLMLLLCLVVPKPVQELRWWRP